MAGSLSDEQRTKWRQRLGEPLDKTVINRISRRL